MRTEGGQGGHREGRVGAEEGQRRGREGTEEGQRRGRGGVEGGQMVDGRAHELRVDKRQEMLRTNKS